MIERTVGAFMKRILAALVILAAQFAHAAPTVNVWVAGAAEGATTAQAFVAAFNAEQSCTGLTVNTDQHEAVYGLVLDLDRESLDVLGFYIVKGWRNPNWTRVDATSYAVAASEACTIIKRGK